MAVEAPACAHAVRQSAPRSALRSVRVLEPICQSARLIGGKLSRQADAKATAVCAMCCCTRRRHRGSLHEGLPLGPAVASASDGVWNVTLSRSQKLHRERLRQAPEVAAVSGLVAVPSAAAIWISSIVGAGVGAGTAALVDGARDGSDDAGLAAPQRSDKVHAARYLLRWAL